MNTFHTQEPVGHGTTGITRSSHEHIHLLLTFLLNEIAQQACHKSATHILEGQSRSMEQFQGIDVFLHLYGRYIEAQSIINNLLQDISRHILAKESIRYLISDFLERQVFNVIIKRLWKTLDDFRHI